MDFHKCDLAYSSGMECTEEAMVLRKLSYGADPIGITGEIYAVLK